LILYQDDLVARPFGEPREVFFSSRVVREYFEDVAHAETVHGLTRLKQRLRAEQADAVQGLLGGLFFMHIGLSQGKLALLYIDVPGSSIP
jgi:hypothetical protein